MESQSQERKGMVYAAGAYVVWGVLPMYWKLVDNVAAEEILANRVVWSFVFMLLVLAGSRRLGDFGRQAKALLRQPKPFISLIIASLLISVNWFIYIWAVNNNHIIEASLGYYINPLVSILLGTVVLRERLSFWQYVSVLLAAAGVGVLTWNYGSFPWVSVTLAVSFALYGLAKKLTNFDSMVGLTFETLVITPIALIYLLMQGGGSFGTEVPLSLLLMGAGAATALPLLYFAMGAKLIPLSMIGFLQYIAPTISLGLGVFLYHEHFTHTHLIAFSCIWSALVLFSFANTRLLRHMSPKFGRQKSMKAS
ncbi:EamA family transporter RarD [Ectobacillus ponti]|uniref:EamA family transporter RarD n=1 Tax=Ectobacillus ponti TaxID=2961894 RepID=A0AA41XBU7_9BACI|nr:EamA family transporter RarD [Ectobacillus ponti]MCP8969166.1 EamA family transporter RarD [Ectobacillus ponti]